MVVATKTSFAVALICSILIFSGMQMYKPWLNSSQLHIIFAGYMGSLIFTLTLTAIGNLETFLFGKNFQLRVFPEIIVTLLLAVFAAGTIHRVCATSCLILSSCSLYYMNRYSQKVHVTPVPVVQSSGKKKKNN